jgi:hypothetical protein
MVVECSSILWKGKKQADDGTRDWRGMRTRSPRVNREHREIFSGDAENSPADRYRC